MTTRVICLVNDLVSKFNDGIKNNIRWKPGIVTAEKKHLKDKGVFVFSATELLKFSQIRSYFSRPKSSQKKKDVNRRMRRRGR